MAIITGKFANNSKNCYPYLEYSYTQDIANNTSTITVKLYVKKLNGYATSWQASCGCNIKIDGAVAWSATQRVDLRPVSVGASLFVGQATRTISHHADGTRACDISGYVGLTSISLGAGNAGGTVWFPTIPRKTTVRTEGPTTFGSTITIHHVGASSAFTHSIGAWIGGTYREIAYNKSGTSTQWTIPVELQSLIPNSTQCGVTIILDTLANGQVIGTSETSFTAIVPDSTVPTIGEVTFSDAVNKPAGVTGYWQNFSKLKAVINASGAYGSKIESYHLSVGGDISVWSYSNVVTTGTLWWNGTFHVNVEVIDTRGRRASKHFPLYLNVTSYIAPSITKLEYERMENTEGSERPSNMGTIGYLTYAITWHGTSTNRKVRFLWKTKSAKEFTDSIDMSGYPVSINKHNFSRTLSSADAYILRLEVSDQLQTIVHQIEMTNIFPLISMNPQGTGLAFGKEAIDDYLLDCAMGIQMAPDKRIRKHGVSSSWTQGCKGINALFYMDTHEGYCPLFAQKTANGAWALGVNDHNAWRFSYMTDEHMNDGSNAVHTQYALPLSGGIWEVLGADTGGNLARHNLMIDTLNSGANGYGVKGGNAAGTLTSSGNAVTLFSNNVTQMGAHNRFNDIVIFTDYIETNQRLFARQGVFTDTISYNSWDGWNASWATGCMSHFVPTSTERYCGTSANRWQGFYCINPVNVSSDRRMKENIEYLHESEDKMPMSLFRMARANSPITSADLLAFIRDDLKIASYDYKIDDSSLTRASKSISDQHHNKQVGFIAQDIVNTKVGSVIITEDPDGMLSYETGNYMSVIAGALQEEIKVRERELQDAKNTISSMRADIEALRLEVQNKSIK